jgi:hypothetical protein
MSCLLNSVILTVVMASMVDADIGKLSCTCGVPRLGIHVHVIDLNHDSAIDTHIFIFLYFKGRVLVSTKHYTENKLKIVKHGPH